MFPTSATQGDRYCSRTRARGRDVQVHDPIASAEEMRHEYGIKLTPLEIVAASGCGDPCRCTSEDYVAEGWPLVVKLLKDGKGLCWT